MQPQARDACGEKKDFARIMIGGKSADRDSRHLENSYKILLYLIKLLIVRFEHVDATKKRVYNDLIYKKRI